MKLVWIVDDDEEMGRAWLHVYKCWTVKQSIFFHPRAAAKALLAGGTTRLDGAGHQYARSQRIGYA